MKIKSKITGMLICFFLLTLSCKKSDFLKANPKQSNVLPTTVADYQAILDNSANLNSVPILLEAATDNYYMRKGFFASQTQQNQNVYIWNDDIWKGNLSVSSWNWNWLYNIVFNANISIDGIGEIKPNIHDKAKADNVKGSALFLRGFCFYQLAQLYAPAYDPQTVNKDWGIPLRLRSDINEQIRRATMRETYDRILEDLLNAKDLLPNVPDYYTRPNKPAALAALARTYLVMGDFNNALKYASECLGIKNELLDYNIPNIVRNDQNAEVIWPAKFSGLAFLPMRNSTVAPQAVDTSLLKSYSNGDLRATVFYQKHSNQTLGGSFFKGGYTISDAVSGAIATDEIYLIRAECYARLGYKDLAIADLNLLIQKRWKNDGSWTPFAASSAEEALLLILTERRKELAFRGLRWSDIRRLNKLGADITLTRKLDDGTVIILPPNSLKYTYLIPPEAISFHPDMPQNPR